MIIAPFVLIFLPSDFFDYGESICPSYNFFGIRCPGCGITRATMHLIHFEFKEAWAFNKLSFFLDPILLFLYVKIIIKYFKKAKAEPAAGKGY